MGSGKPTDVVWTRYVGPVLLSEELVNTLHTEGITGWSTYPVEMKGKNGEPLPTYCGLVVLGRCGPATSDHGTRVMKEFPGGFFPVQRGLSFDESSWDGSDVFMPVGATAYVFVTDRFREIILARAKNVRFTPLGEIEQQVM
jgi:hypothetical protein